MKLLLIAAFSITTYSYSSGQSDIPKLDTLEASLRTYYTKAWAADREEFIVSQKGQILNYIPSFGIAMGLPTVGYNTSKIYDYALDKKVRQQKLKSIDSQYLVRYNEELNNLRIEYQKVKAEEKYLTSLVKLSDLKAREFAIYQEAYDKKEMKPLDYIGKSYEYESHLNNLEKLRLEMDIKILELKKLARYHMQQDTLDNRHTPDMLTNNR
jgi:hypothetical protein